jgi:hypothetical protein
MCCCRTWTTLLLLGPPGHPLLTFGLLLQRSSWDLQAVLAASKMPLGRWQNGQRARGKLNWCSAAQCVRAALGQFSVEPMWECLSAPFSSKGSYQPLCLVLTHKQTRGVLAPASTAPCVPQCVLVSRCSTCKASIICLLYPTYLQHGCRQVVDTYVGGVALWRPRLHLRPQFPGRISTAPGAVSWSRNLGDDALSSVSGVQLTATKSSSAAWRSWCHQRQL